MAASVTGKSPRAWQRMLSGRRLDLLDPSPLDIEIEDIAHGLARVARWNGQTKGDHAYSVAQHCLLVERFVHELRPRGARPLRLAALLHDAAEYVIGDLISPFKAAVGLDYKAFENQAHSRHPCPLRAAARKHPRRSRADQTRRSHLGVFRSDATGGFHACRGAQILRFPARVCPPALVPLPVTEAQALYLERFRKLSA